MPVRSLPQLSLEDRLFGPEECESGDPVHPPDPYAGIMVPLLVAALLIGVALWSMSKSMQYNEVFTVNRRYRYGLYAANAVVIVVAVLVLSIHHRRQHQGHTTKHATVV